MRTFSWAGGIALATAVGTGYLACEWVHHQPAGCCVQSCHAPEIGETSEQPPPRPDLTEPVEEIDLTCLPMPLPHSFTHHTPEPPLANAPPGAVRPAHYELPVGPVDGPPAPLAMPYLKDDADDAPAKLPMLDDAPPAAAVPSGLLFEAVKKFFQDAAKLPAFSVPRCPSLPPMTDELPPGEAQAAPEAGEAQEAPPVRTPIRLAPIRPTTDSPPRAKVDTMEARPGEGRKLKLTEPY